MSTEQQILASEVGTKILRELEVPINQLIGNLASDVRGLVETAAFVAAERIAETRNPVRTGGEQ